jgi:hypothetical protein
VYNGYACGSWDAEMPGCWTAWQPGGEKPRSGRAEERPSSVAGYCGGWRSWETAEEHDGYKSGKITAFASFMFQVKKTDCVKKFQIPRFRLSNAVQRI